MDRLKLGGENQQKQILSLKQSPQTSSIKLKISSSGDIDLEVSGEMTEENKEAITSALQQAEFYRQQANKIEQEKLKKSGDVDAVMVVFVASLLSITMVLSYMVVSALSSKFSNQSNIEAIYKVGSNV